ncbi:MAG: ethanolamine utilization microcompartment protein EutL [Myxococcales bacterium]|nr:ethanolamine utilization microcompartment protein EutL [Myxococcales bacterium]
MPPRRHKPPTPARRTPLVDLVPIKPRVLSVRAIPRADEGLARKLGLPDGLRALGLLTCTSDDALFVALDEGTKAAPVEVVYARSFYAGSSYPSGPLSGEAIGIYAARDPDEIAAALAACRRCLDEEAWFYAADERGQLAFFPHVVRATGRYLSKEAGIDAGRPMAYLIAPPLESVVGLDAALKAAPVTLAKWFGPPSETNYGGGYLVGELADCEAAASAFAAAVVDVARSPLDADRSARAAGETVDARPSGATTGKYRVLATGERLGDKPEHLTHLRDDQSLVEKSHPRLPLRGKLDMLQGLLLDAQIAADVEGARGLVGELGEALDLVRAIVGCEVMDRPLPSWKLLAMEPAELRRASHHTLELYGVPFMYPAVNQGPVVAKLYLARAYSREAELKLYEAFPGDERGDLKLACNRLSSALYLMTTKYVGGHYGGERRRLGPVKGWKPA